MRERERKYREGAAANKAEDRIKGECGVMVN
jgi:hypothetical protein